MTLQKLVDGVTVDMSPEEEAATLAEWAAADAAQAAPKLVVPVLACVANLHVEDGDVSGISAESGLSFAFMIDTDVIWAFFANPMTSDAYGWAVNSTNGVAKVTSRQVDFLEISVTGATEPFDISLQIYTVE